MTRSWKFTLTSNTLWYNIWDLIVADSSFTDATFTTAPFVPSSVCELVIAPDSAAVSVSEDPKQELGLAIAVAASYIKRTTVNAIPLKSFSLKSATSGATCDVSITAI